MIGKGLESEARNTPFTPLLTRASVFVAVAVIVMLDTPVIDCREERMAAPIVPEGFEFTLAMFAEIVASSLS